MDPGCRLPLTISIPMERAMAPWIRRGAPASSFIAHCPLCFTGYNGAIQGRKVPDLWRPLIVHVETAIRATMIRMFASIQLVRAVSAAPASYYYPTEVGSS
jgi:hypothetical protein